MHALHASSIDRWVIACKRFPMQIYVLLTRLCKVYNVCSSRHACSPLLTM